jgi:hypothetical protein
MPTTSPSISQPQIDAVQTTQMVQVSAAPAHTLASIPVSTLGTTATAAPTLEQAGEEHLQQDGATPVADAIGQEADHRRANNVFEAPDI